MDWLAVQYEALLAAVCRDPQVRISELPFSSKFQDHSPTSNSRLSDELQHFSFELPQKPLSTSAT
jgi:hypothetical protein